MKWLSQVKYAGVLVYFPAAGQRGVLAFPVNLFLREGATPRLCICFIDVSATEDYQFLMANIKDLTKDQIQRIIVIKKKIEKLHATVHNRIEKLHSKIESIVDRTLPPPLVALKKKKRRMSRAGRAAIAAAARARWAKVKAAGKKRL
jgi:hypothetical protein